MPATTTPPKFLTTAEVAETIRVREPVVYHLIKTAGLPARRAGRRWLIDPAELDIWLRSREGGTQSAVGAEVDPDWVAAQVAKFSPDDLRRAGELLLALSRSSNTQGAA